jgi:hypothetical protein
MSWAADAFVVKSGDLAELKQKVQQILGESETPEAQGVGVTDGRCGIFRPEAA